MSDPVIVPDDAPDDWTPPGYEVHASDNPPPVTEVHAENRHHDG